MSLRAFNQGCNVIAFTKDDKKYGMVCAWATMIDYDKIGMLIGSQSVTGKMIKNGDIVGVSALAEGQKDIAIKLGENHSDEVDKFDGIDLLSSGSALYVKGSKVKMACQVLRIVTLIDRSDRFVILKVTDYKSNKDVKFLTLDDVYPEE